MKDIKYICPGCGFESAVAGSCPECRARLGEKRHWDVSFNTSSGVIALP